MVVHGHAEEADWEVLLAASTASVSSNRKGHDKQNKFSVVEMLNSISRQCR
jgi:hypothetical protein